MGQAAKIHSLFGATVLEVGMKADSLCRAHKGSTLIYTHCIHVHKKLHVLYVYIQVSVHIQAHCLLDLYKFITLFPCFQSTCSFHTQVA